MSLLDHVDPGRYVYQIQVRADYTTGTADLGSVTINAVDLGRQ